MQRVSCLAEWLLAIEEGLLHELSKEVLKPKKHLLEVDYTYLRYLK
jgi:hypothetical protein